VTYPGIMSVFALQDFAQLQRVELIKQQEVLWAAGYRPVPRQFCLDFRAELDDPSYVLTYDLKNHASQENKTPQSYEVEELPKISTTGRK